MERKLSTNKSKLGGNSRRGGFADLSAHFNDAVSVWDVGGGGEVGKWEGGAVCTHVCTCMRACVLGKGLERACGGVSVCTVEHPSSTSVRRTLCMGHVPLRPCAACLGGQQTPRSMLLHPVLLPQVRASLRATSKELDLAQQEFREAVRAKADRCGERHARSYQRQHIVRREHRPRMHKPQPLLITVLVPMIVPPLSPTQLCGCRQDG